MQLTIKDCVGLRFNIGLELECFVCICNDNAKNISVCLALSCVL